MTSPISEKDTTTGVYRLQCLGCQFEESFEGPYKNGQQEEFVLRAHEACKAHMRRFKQHEMLLTISTLYILKLDESKDEIVGNPAPKSIIKK